MFPQTRGMGDGFGHIAFKLTSSYVARVLTGPDQNWSTAQGLGTPALRDSGDFNTLSTHKQVQKFPFMLSTFIEHLLYSRP